MKKQLLLMSAAALVSGIAMAAPQTVTFSASSMTPPSATSVMNVPANAGGEDSFIVYTKAGDPEALYTLNNMPSRCTVYLAAEMSVQDQQPYIGCTITAVNVMAGSSSNNGNFPVTKVNAFVTENKNSMPADRTLSDISTTPYSVTSVKLDKPVVITGEKPLYFGYFFSYSSARPCYFLPTDNLPTDASSNNTLVAVTQKVSDAPQYTNYSNQQPGSLCVSINITGDNLPENIGALTGLEVPSYVSGDNLNYVVKIKNEGANDITSAVVRTEISNGSSYTSTISLTDPIRPGSTMQVSVTDVPNENKGVYYLSSSLTEVNGVAVANPVSKTGMFGAYAEGYKRRPVMEEATGTWCQWWPAGIVMMETLAKSYPDWIRIAVHNGDRMAINSYSGFINDYIPGFPYAVANRLTGVYPTGVTTKDYEEMNELFTKNPAYAEISLDYTCSEDQSQVTINAETEVCCDVTIPHMLSFVLVEDHVGPYAQSNAYAGGGNGSMGGWENKGGSVSTYFDDVARAIDSYPGIEGSLPEVMKAGEKYSYSLTMPVSNIRNSWFRVVAMLTNVVTGEIMTAQEVVAYKDNGAGVDGVASDNAVDIKGGYGEVIVNGAHNVAVFTLDGRRVAETGLAAGVYIVKADGVTGKVIVK